MKKAKPRPRAVRLFPVKNEDTADVLAASLRLLAPHARADKSGVLAELVRRIRRICDGEEDARKVFGQANNRPGNPKGIKSQHKKYAERVEQLRARWFAQGMTEAKARRLAEQDANREYGRPAGLKTSTLLTYHRRARRKVETQLRSKEFEDMGQD